MKTLQYTKANKPNLLQEELAALPALQDAEWREGLERRELKFTSDGLNISIDVPNDVLDADVEAVIAVHDLTRLTGNEQLRQQAQAAAADLRTWMESPTLTTMFEIRDVLVNIVKVLRWAANELR